MPYLLDVNVLIALLDTNHVHHVRATHWFMDEAWSDWLSCPITQNGAIRIMSNSRYGPTAFTASAVAEHLRLLMAETGHRFIADDVSLLDASKFELASLTHSNQVTDTYLLALSIRHAAQLATLDHRLRNEGVIGGQSGLHEIPNLSD